MLSRFAPLVAGEGDYSSPTMARLGLASPDIAIDLGTANTLVFVRGQGIVLAEPSVIAMDVTTGRVEAVGSEAKRMIGRTPASISASRPLRHGVIADFDVAEEMLRYFIRRVHRSRFARPRVVMCAPSGITPVEQRAVEEACRQAGARQVHLIEEPLAAAIGAGLAIEEPAGQMVLDVGGGTSEVAVLSLGGIVVSRALRVGGYEIDDAISAHLRTHHRMAIGEGSAEEVKLRAGSAWPLEPEEEFEVRGRDLMSGLPRNLTLDSAELREAIAEPVQAVIDAVHETLEETPPELAADIARSGIVLAGGGSQLRGLDRRLHEETGMRVTLAHSPLTCVAEGAGRALEEFGALVRTGRFGAQGLQGRVTVY
jgi:rod shape-determining protein MreB and related proteins